MLQLVGRVKVSTNTIRKIGKKNGASIIRHMAAVTRRNMKRKIKTSRRTSSPGQPPFTHNGALRRAIVYAQESETMVVVGVSRKLFSGDYDNVPMAKVHEWGGFEVRQFKPINYSNLNFEIGKPGIIAIKNGKVRWIKIKTEKQLERANQLKHQVPYFLKTGRRVRKYPPRPFAVPALKDTIPFIRNYKLRRRRRQRR